MSETTPPVPKSGGSGPFVLAAIVMLLLMGGLIFWKMKSGSETAKVEAPKSTATTEQPVLDEPPPPPPPVASTEPSAKPDKPGTKKITGGSSAGACGPCNGDPTPSIVSALRGRGAQTRGCYEKALRQNAMLSGHIVVGLTVNSSGVVCNAVMKSNELGDPGVATCVLNSLRGASVPPPASGCVEVNLPLNFTPKT